MSEPISDAAVELLGVCKHSLRFAFGAPLGYPYAAAKPAADDPPPVLFRRVQVASPPPSRNGALWRTDLRCGNQPFDPDNAPDALSKVWPREGAVSLDVPKPESIVLDWWFSVPRARETMTFPGPDRDRFFLSVPYWSPAQAGETVTKEVEYFAVHRLHWARPPEQKWIAISFDAFWPPERDSAELITRLGDCDAHCPGTG
jgi:hypothetical protein